MLVLTSFGLVLIATALLVFGLLQDDGLTLIYISIACSLAAGIVLVVATRVNKPKVETTASGSAPLSAADPEPEPEPMAADEAPAEAAPVVEEVLEEESFAPTAATPVVDSGEPFPIADYDDLSVGEILPLLPKLYVDELDVVEAQERNGKNRSQVTAKLAELRSAAAGAPDDVTIEEFLAQAPAASVDEPEAPRVPGPAKKASSTTKKVVKAAPKKAASSTKKAAAPAKKVTTTKKAAPAKKAAAKKAAAPAKKATAKKATAKKAAAPAKKATKATKKSS